MGRFRTRPINPYFQSIMDDPDRNWKTLVEASVATGLSVERLAGIADIDAGHPTINSLLNEAEALKIPVEDYMRGLVGRAKEEKSAAS